MTRPKKTGSIPTPIAMGKSNGVKIVIAAEAFKKQPAIKKITLNKSKITYLLSDIFIISMLNI
ncbi:hypothetical protein AC623_11790 [Bacillus sp. FJAT-27231]|nr:hypothetical protein AC623_11790 [Bacillus sp. FJAT-27231]